MKPPSSELFAQIMFLTGMACFPLSVAFACLGAVSKKIEIALLWFIVAAFTFTHFVFYFNVLGGALGTKVGRYEPPNWFSFLPYCLIGVPVLIGLWILFGKGRKSCPPPLPKQ